MVVLEYSEYTCTYVRTHMLARIVVEIRAADIHRCRVGTSTVVYRDVFYADNAHYWQ
jgi:hypothetical protein